MQQLCKALGVLLLVTAIQQGQGQEAYDDHYFIELVRLHYVEPFREGDVDKWLDAFDAQAIALHNRRPADRGREAIATFGRTVHQHFDLAEYAVEVTDVRRSADWVYTVGVFTTRFVSKADGSEPFGREKGKFVLLWARQPDGGWKIILDMGNSNL
jgi:ketosteroid isomerase-like protein